MERMTDRTGIGVSLGNGVVNVDEDSRFLT